MTTTRLPSPTRIRTPRDSGPRPPALPRRRAKPRVGSNIFLLAAILYFAVPMWWLLVAATKSNSGLFAGTGGPLFFDSDFALFDNIAQLFSHENGIYARWLGNSFLYAFGSGLGATVLAVAAGYGFAKYRFRGSAITFAAVLGSVMVPATVLAIPTFMLLSSAGILNTPWAVILPSMLNPFGVYLMRVFAQDAVPSELLDAARIDGASEVRAFFSVAFPLLRPATVTVFLLSTVGTLNNFFLPLIVLTDRNLLPVTLGLNYWFSQSTSNSGGMQLWNLVTTGSLISVIPLVIAFLLLQRYWQAGISLGSLK